ncbi:MAG: TonB-dependent receptor [Erythrobacter sp.]|uniref:TonB-dependent receptor domain-containing protein n=1 Tax=Erythrobacter sp. TaxID=1042 RepID=UPI00262BDAAD|nr:TonB-dependent receptor [Erythrobacter sp.]MDJ0979923.1 TonB-dependent receptor [Erythrobacter sp.]
MDSPGTRFENETVSALVGARLDLLNSAWTHDLSAQITDANRQTDAPTGFPSSTESDRFEASFVTVYDSGGTDHSLTFAADYELEGFNNVLTFDDRNEAENIGFVGQYRYAGDDFDVSASLRHDINDLFEDATTFRVGAGFRVTDTTRLRASLGTGVKNPTLSALFGFFDGVFVGDPDLQPEKSTGWEVGLDQTLAARRLTVSLTYFNAELEYEIFSVFDPVTFVSSPDNRTTKSAQQGVELAGSADLGSGFTFNGAYSFLEAEENGAEGIRRPNHLASAVLDWTAKDKKASANLAVRYNGEALDDNFATFPATVETLEAYTLVNFNVRVKLIDGIYLFGRIENLLDEQYEQVFSFVSPGVNGLVGFEARF